MFSIDKQFAFIHIPNTAGSSITTAIAGYCEHVPQSNITHADSREARDMAFASIKYQTDDNDRWQQQFHVDPEALKDVSNETFVFAFVRNPYSRIISAFKSTCKPVTQLSDWLLSPITTQSELLSDRVDYVGRYETLDADWEHVCRKIKIRHLKLPIVNASIDVDYNWMEYLKTKEHYQIVNRLYHEDFVNFNYIKQHEI